MNLGGGYEFPFGRLTMTLALHSSSMPDGSYAGNPCGFVLAREGRRAYFACDTALFSDMKLIGAAGLDLAAVPIGDNYTMGPDDALEAVRLLKPRRVVPIHNGTWPIIAQDAEAWARRVRAETGAEAVVLKPGGRRESVTVPNCLPLRNCHEGNHERKSPLDSGDKPRVLRRELALFRLRKRNI